MSAKIKVPLVGSWPLPDSLGRYAGNCTLVSILGPWVAHAILHWVVPLVPDPLPASGTLAELKRTDSRVGPPRGRCHVPIRWVIAQWSSHACVRCGLGLVVTSLPRHGGTHSTSCHVLFQGHMSFWSMVTNPPRPYYFQICYPQSLNSDRRKKGGKRRALPGVADAPHRGSVRLTIIGKRHAAQPSLGYGADQSDNSTLIFVPRRLSPGQSRHTRMVFVVKIVW